jgi:hypothetical protein
MRGFWGCWDALIVLHNVDTFVWIVGVFNRNRKHPRVAASPLEGHATSTRGSSPTRASQAPGSPIQREAVAAGQGPLDLCSQAG